MIYGSLYSNELYANMVCSNKLSTLNQNTVERNIQPDSFNTQTHVCMCVVVKFKTDLYITRWVVSLSHILSEAI